METGAPGVPWEEGWRKPRKYSDFRTAQTKRLEAGGRGRGVQAEQKAKSRGRRAPRQEPRRGPPRVKSRMLGERPDDVGHRRHVKKRVRGSDGVLTYGRGHPRAPSSFLVPDTTPGTQARLGSQSPRPTFGTGRHPSCWAPRHTVSAPLNGAQGRPRPAVAAAPAGTLGRSLRRGDVDGRR